MASLPLDFTPPEDPGIVKLRILEASDPGGPYSIIEEVTNIGTYPNYITRYTTINALSLTDWFAIQWISSTGAESEISAPLQGGSKTLVSEVLDRVLLRRSDFDENVAAQVTEAVIDYALIGDPYAIDVNSVSYKQLEALTELVIVWKLYAEVATSASFNTTSYTAGLVSETASAQSQKANPLEALDKLEQRALKILGLGIIGTLASGTSFIGQLVDPDSPFSITGTKTVINSSRLLSTTAIITEQAALREVT